MIVYKINYFAILAPKKTNTTQNKNQDVQKKDIVLGPRNVFTRDQN